MAESSSAFTASMSTSKALKEWASVVKALNDGQQILLLRKGGVGERGFQLQGEVFALFPTYEHQAPQHLKEGAEGLLKASEAYRKEDGSITITSWARVEEVLRVEGEGQLKALEPYHIWSEEYVKERYEWMRGDRPLHLLLLRVHGLKEPQLYAPSPKYRGCKSWIELERPLYLEPSAPILQEGEFSALKLKIKEALLGAR